MIKYDNLKGTVDTKEPKKPISSLEHHQNFVISYLKLRKYVGILGFVLPLLILVSAVFMGFLPSISDYYYTFISPLFTGSLILIVVILLVTKSSDPTEKTFNILIVIGAAFTIIFPTNVNNQCKIVAGHVYSETELKQFFFYTKGFNPVTGYMHKLGALTFFISSILLINKNFIPFENENKSENSEFRIKTYKICIGVMISCLILIVISQICLNFLDIKNLADFAFPIIFTCETFLLIAFGISWLTKSNTLDGLLKK